MWTDKGNYNRDNNMDGGHLIEVDGPVTADNN